jgi:malonyl-ACP decarboxylase
MTCLAITGMGVAAAGTLDTPGFAASLRAGRTAIADLPRDPMPPIDRAALLPRAAFVLPPGAPRGATRAAASAALVAREAWDMAGLAAADPERVALVLAGHNLSLAATAETLRAYADRMAFAPPRHALQVWDSHVAGVVSQLLGIRGAGLLAGGHFASGVAALAQAALLLRAGEADAAVCVAPAAELSDLELHALANLGVTASVGDTAGPYQPFAAGQGGLVPGQGAACLIMETAPHAAERGAAPLAWLAAARVVLGGHAGPEPDANAAMRAMRAALAAAGLAPSAIGYVNAHATGTPAGDAAEAEAIRVVFDGASPRVNATKAITGHTLCAAGLVGVVATLLQMRGGFLHADPYLQDAPAGLYMAGPAGDSLSAEAAMVNSFGFDGFYGSAILTVGRGDGA